MFTSFHQINLRGIARRCVGWLTTGAMHLVGMAVVFAISSWLLIPSQSRSALHEAYHHGLMEAATAEIALHAGLSFCFWALLYIGWKLIVSSKPSEAGRLVKARGTVIVETLVVFPVFLLVTLGLMQLAILNTGALLTTLAAFHAGRTASIWVPENMEPRQEVNAGVVQDKIHMAAAGAVAPAVPSDFATDANVNSPSLDARLDALEDLGHDQQPSVAADATLSVAGSFDGANMASRGLNKMTFAYCAVEVHTTWDGDPGCGPTNISTVVVYNHQLAFPFVNRIFGDGATIAGRTGHYSRIIREHSTTMQIPPNPATPGGMGGWGDRAGCGGGSGGSMSSTGC